MEENKKEYITTIAFASQLSDLKKGDKTDYRFLSLNAKKILKDKDFQENFGEYDKVSMIVPSFAVRGAKIDESLEKVYSVDFDETKKAVDFDPLVVNKETRHRESGKHIIAQISLPVSEKVQEVKLTLSRKNDKGEYENSTVSVPYSTLKSLFIENNNINCESIKKFKLKRKENKIVDSEIEEEILFEPDENEESLEESKTR